MKFLVKKNKNEICGLCKKPANRGVVTFLDAYYHWKNVVAGISESIKYLHF